MARQTRPLTNTEVKAAKATDKPNEKASRNKHQKLDTR